MLLFRGRFSGHRLFECVRDGSQCSDPAGALVVTVDDLPRGPARVAMGKHFMPSGLVTIACRVAAQVFWLHAEFAPGMRRTLVKPLRLNVGADVEEKLHEKRSVFRLLRFKLIDLVERAEKPLVLHFSQRPRPDDSVVPASEVEGAVARFGQSHPIGRQPVLARFAEFILSDAPGSEVAWVPTRGHAPQCRQLARAFPTLKHHDRAFLVDNLGELKLRKLLLQSVTLRMIVTGERRFPFNFA